MTNLVIFLVGLVIMLVLMMKTKLGPFICMLLAGLGIGIACGLGSDGAISTLVDGFGGTCKSIGLSKSVHQRGDRAVRAKPTGDADSQTC